MSIRDKLLSGPLGFGGAPLGYMFRNVPDEEAAATVEAAWRQGVRYFVAPLNKSCSQATRGIASRSHSGMRQCRPQA